MLQQPLTQSMPNPQHAIRPISQVHENTDDVLDYVAVKKTYFHHSP